MQIPFCRMDFLLQIQKNSPTLPFGNLVKQEYTDGPEYISLEFDQVWH